MFKVGDQVLAIDDDIKGVIKSISGDFCVIESMDGFEVNYHSKEIILDQTATSNLDYSKNFSEFKKSNTSKSINKSPKVLSKKARASVPAMEVDLHIHKLVASTKGMTNYDMLNLQLDTAKRQLDFAISKKISRVIFIHGVGEGVLKAELEYELRKIDDIQIYEADYKKYGFGALEVYISQSKFF